jgi:hypothetical protein
VGERNGPENDADACEEQTGKWVHEDAGRDRSARQKKIARADQIWASTSDVNPRNVTNEPERARMGSGRNR